MAMAATPRTALGLGACARPRRRSPGASPGMTRTFLAADASARGLSGVGAHGSARKIGGGVVRPGARRPARPVAALGPNEVNELAGTTLLTLSGFEAVLGKVSFGSLLAATSIYEYKVRSRRRHAPIADPRAIARSRRPSPVTPTSPAEDQRPSTRSIHLTLNPTSRPPARLASHPAPLFPTPTTRAGVLHR